MTRVLRNNRVIQEYAPKRGGWHRQTSDTGARILDAIRQAERCGETPSVRQLVTACGLSSTSIVLYWLRRLARDGDLVLGPKGAARSYRLTVQGRGGPSDAELLARLQEKHDADQAAFRQIRRWIEGEDMPGEWTAEIYGLAGKALDY